MSMTTRFARVSRIALGAAAFLAALPARADSETPQAAALTDRPVEPATAAPSAPGSAAAQRPTATDAPPAAPPPSEKSDWGAELRCYMGFGGEKIAQVKYSDGSSSNLALGTYFFLGLGGIYSPWRWQHMGLDLELLAGWASWSTGPDNTDDRLRLSRFPLEALAYYRHVLSDTPGGEMLLRIGGGVSYHLIGGVSGTGSLDGAKLDFDNAFGGVFEASVVYTALALGLRYTPMKYRTTEEGRSLDASSIGVFFSVVLEPGLL